MSHRYTDDDFGLTLLMQSFHRDWRHKRSEFDVLDVTLWPGQDPRAVTALRHDASLLATSLADGQISVLWLAGTDGPLLNDPPGRAWMAGIAERCDWWFGEHGCDPAGPLTDDPEADLEDDVGQEIGQVRARFAAHDPPWTLGTWDDVGPALISCAERCTPGLAFRMLLCVVCCNGVEIGREQYSRFVRLGERFGYGEFLVGRAEPFVA